MPPGMFVVTLTQCGGQAGPKALSMSPISELRLNGHPPAERTPVQRRAPWHYGCRCPPWCCGAFCWFCCCWPCCLPVSFGLAGWEFDCFVSLMSTLLAGYAGCFYKKSKPRSAADADFATAELSGPIHPAAYAILPLSYSVRTPAG